MMIPGNEASGVGVGVGRGRGPWNFSTGERSAARCGGKVSGAVPVCPCVPYGVRTPAGGRARAHHAPHVHLSHATVHLLLGATETAARGRRAPDRDGPGPSNIGPVARRSISLDFLRQRLTNCPPADTPARQHCFQPLTLPQTDSEGNARTRPPTRHDAPTTTPPDYRRSSSRAAQIPNEFCSIRTHFKITRF